MNQIHTHGATEGAVRVRIAPSPTGRLHIGNLRAALFNWLFARRNSGTFIVRIEDTDLERSKKEYVDSILDAFAWVGMHSDETIVYQSERTDVYRSYIDSLVASGAAYWSDPLSEENGTSVVRFRVPRHEQSVTFTDCIRGPITVPIDQIDDFVIARADGSPLYNFVVVIDDMVMRMTHVIRGEDHISNTPKQLLLYRALGVMPPHFAHLPLILGVSGAPLSKRDAATAVLDYKEQGYLPDALCNYLVRLGWSHGDQEIFSRDEMIALFDIADVQKAGAIFDVVKLRWMNSQYLRAMSASAILAYMSDVLSIPISEQFADWTRSQLEALVDLYKDRVATVRELEAVLQQLHTGPIELPEAPMFTEQSSLLLRDFLMHYPVLESYDRDSIESLIRRLCSHAGVGLVLLAKPLRYAITGSMESPSIFMILSILGYDTVYERIAKLDEVLRGKNG